MNDSPTVSTRSVPHTLLGRIVQRIVPYERCGLGLFMCLLSSAVFAMDAHAPALKTVKAVDLSRYVGTWYEIARYPNRFQTHCADQTTATYTALPTSGNAAARLSVVNRCVDRNGAVDEAHGVARVIDTTSHAKLTVSFLPAWLRWTRLGQGQYWVIGLADDYRYAVVGEPTRTYVWILARTPRISAGDRADIEELLKSQGYDPSRLIDSPQSGA